SYGKGKTSSGEVTVLRDISEEVAGCKVLLIDDILESGTTLSFARQLMLSRGAVDVRLCVLLDKQGKRRNDLEADYVGFVCPDKFVVGYG
ncbi:phosphoribosyltransferase family protein, partial [Acinetobacter baumannii]